MSELIKIKDMTGRYDISARTLRYYEDMGLLTSVRSDDYAYRLYDDAAVKRLEQILILRKLNIIAIYPDIDISSPANFPLYCVVILTLRR